MVTTTTGAQLDPRLREPTAPFGAALVEEILGDHGPQQPGGETCQGCGFRYRVDAADCPSVLFALALRGAEVPG
jgi:hypothetical protein